VSAAESRSDSVTGILDLLMNEPEDELSEALHQAHLMLLLHPVAARAAFRAFAREGRRFAETEEGRAWKERLAGSELIRRGRSVWEVATLGMLEERDSALLPTQLVDALCYAAGLPDLEPALARAVEPKVRRQHAPPDTPAVVPSETTSDVVEDG